MTVSKCPLWDRLVRFRDDESGQILYGNAQRSTEGSIEEDGISVEVLKGESIWNLEATGKIVTLKKLLGPLDASQVPIVRCIGLNYKTHIQETGHPLPTNPTLFIKPSPSIADHSESIPIPKTAQAMLDYEGELCIIIGKQGKNIPEDEALDYIAGYTVGNDISARDWQTNPEMAGSRPQWCYGKSFDKFAPLGPALISPSILGDCSSSSLVTKVNGKVRQSGHISDLVFGVRKLVAYCSNGQTLQRGTVIMTGTPGGVGLFMNPKQFLQDGDEVSITISGIGTLTNVMKFE